MPEKRGPKRLRAKLRPLDGLPEYAPPPTGDQVVATFIVKKKPKVPRKEDTKKVREELAESLEENIFDDEAVENLARLVKVLDKGRKK